MTKGSDLLVVAALENEGVEYIFGVPGGENLDVVESLRTSRIKLVLTWHEQSATRLCWLSHWAPRRILGGQLSSKGTQHAKLRPRLKSAPWQPRPVDLMCRR